MNKTIYPSPYEIQEVLNSYSKRAIVDLFSQSRGIFFMNARQDEVSKDLSYLLYDETDIEELRALAYQMVSKHTLSGFTIRSKSDVFSLVDLYNSIRDHGSLHSKGYKLKSLQRISKSAEKAIYKGAIEYTKKKPGRIEFLEEETGYSEFYFFETSNGEWQIEVDGNKSSDGKEVQKLILGVVDKNSQSLFNINIEALQQKNTIQFFDELAKSGLGTDWRFTDVKHLAFKRGNKTNEDESEDGDSEEIAEDELTGISQAILEGRNLRDDPFVRQYEKGGCIFTAMTYEFEHTTLPQTVQMRAEFKGSPKIFEVSIVDYKVTRGLEAKKETSELSTEDNRSLRSLFWNNAKKVFENLI